MRGEERRERRGEEEVAELRDVRVPRSARRQSADLAQRTRDARRIPRELDGARVGEELALAADRGLDEPSEERAERAGGVEQQAEGHDAESHRSAVVLASAPRVREHRPDVAKARPPDESDHEDPEDHAGQADVQAHVAVENVAEFVGHDALQLRPIELRHAAAGHPDHRALRRVAGGEGVDRVVVDPVDRRDRHARGDRHLLDDVEEPPLVRVAGRGLDPRAAEHLRDRFAALAELGDLEEARESDDEDDKAGDRAKKRGIPEGNRCLRGVRGGERQVDRRDKGDDREDEEDDEPPGAAPRVVLGAEVVHARPSAELVRSIDTDGGAAIAA